MRQRWAMADSTLTAAEFHNLAHKRILNAVTETLAGTKMDWDLVAPLLDAARDVCRGDLRDGARLRFHTVRAEGDQWVDAEEAFLGLAVADRESGEDWLSETWWVSQIALADPDPEQVRHIAAALERSLARIREWLAEQDKSGPGRSPELPLGPAGADGAQES